MRRLAIHFACWTALALISAGQGLLTYMATGGDIYIKATVLLNLAAWYPWAAVSPVIWWAGRRFPLTRDAWIRHALTHIALNAILAVITGLTYRALRFAIGLPPRGDYMVQIAAGLNIALLVYWSIIAIAHSMAYYRNAETQRRAGLERDRQLAEARLGALRAQIQPHFLFNTLHAIASRVGEDPRGAEDMLGELGELLRTGLHSGPLHESTLAEELALMDRYIAIQAVRFRDRMTVERSIDPEALEALVPVLILQPLVENAIEHGISQRIEGGTLRIEATVRNSTPRDRSVLEIRISDLGAHDRPAPATAAERRGIGLSNTRERIAQLYGEAGSIKLDANGSGVTATVTIPFHTMQKEQPA